MGRLLRTTRRVTLPLLLMSVTVSLAPDTWSQTQFQVRFGGPSNDEASAIVQTSDGGYAIAGHTHSFATGHANFYVVKFDDIGSIQWTRFVGGSDNDRATSIVQTSDGGYAVAGHSTSFGSPGVPDFYIVRLDSNGEILWERVFTGVSSATGDNTSDRPYAIVQTPDGGFAVAGSSFSFYGPPRGSYMSFMKLDGNGVLQWRRLYGGVFDGHQGDEAFDMILTADGGYALAGYTRNLGPGIQDVYVVKIDANGSVQWSSTVGGPLEDIAHAIVQTADGGYAVAGETESYGGGALRANMYAVRLDALGSLLWTTTIGGTGNDKAYSIIQTTDGGYALTGFSFTFGNDLALVKLSPLGAVTWMSTAGGVSSQYGRSLVQTADGGYAVAGYHSDGFGSTAYMVKFDHTGSTCGVMAAPDPPTGTGGMGTSPTTLVYIPITVPLTPMSITGSGGSVSNSCLVTGGLAFTPPTLYAEVTAGQTTTESVTMHNESGETIAFQITEFPFFVGNVVPQMGYLAGEASIDLSVTFDGSAAPVGDHQGIMVIETDEANIASYPYGLNLSVTGTIDTEGGTDGAQFAIEQNFPNPFTGRTSIEYVLPEASRIVMEVYDARGRQVITLVDTEMEAGSHIATWDASDVAAGLYFFRIQAGGFSRTVPAVVVR